MQVDQHITTCPLLNQNAGLEPYPQPSIVFSAAVSGTAQVRIYDVGANPMAELTTSALSGAELTSPTLTGLSNNYVLDMGHANVRAVVDCMTQENLEVVVMFEDAGGTGEQRFVRVSCNTPEHVEKLYPEGAIYADKGSGNTGIGFPNGSIFQKCSDLGDASQLIVSRGSKLLDLAGSFASSGDITAAKLGTRLNGITIRNLGGGDFRIYHPEQIDFNGVSFEGSPTARSFGIRCMRPNSTTAFAKVVGQMGFTHCGIRNVFAYNGGGHTYSVLNFRNCDIRSSSAPTVGVWENVGGGATSLYAMIFKDCDFQPGGCTLNLQNLQADLDVISSSGDFTIENFSSGTYNPSPDINLLRCRGSGDITLASSVVNCTVNAGGVYNSVINNGTGNTVNEKQLAHTSGLTGNIVNLAAGSITSTEAPNLDAAISTRSAFNAASDTVTVGTNNDKTGYAMAGTLQSLDALDTAQDTQHASTRADIATVDGLVDTLIARLTAARATNLDNLDAASSTLATSAALATVDGLVDTLIARLTAARATNLDNLDAASSTLATSSALATVDGLVDTLVARLTAARAANLDNLDVASSTLATSSALATVDANVDSLLVRLGADDVAIVKGLLLGNYVLDGGSGNTSAQYDSNGVMTAGRVRVFASSAAASGATLGAANGADSEIARVDVTASAVTGKAYPATVQGLLT